MTSTSERTAAGRGGPGRVLIAVVFWAGLLALFGSSLLSHVRLSVSGKAFNDDVRAQVYPLLRYEDPAPFRGDYAGDYFNSLFPVGYRALYGIAALLGGVEGLSRFLPYGLLVLTLLGVGLVARRLGGALAAWIALALCLGSYVYLGCMAGGVPRAFGFPIVAGILIALAFGNARALAALALAGAAFYPVAAVVAGLCLLLVLLDPLPGDRGDAAAWSFRRRVAVLAGVAAGCGLLVLPQVISARPFGPLITSSVASRFPETGPGGRYRSKDRPPFTGFVRTGVRDLETTIPGVGKPLVPPVKRWAVEGGGKRLRWILGLLLGVAGAGWVRLAVRHAEARRLLLFPLVGAAGYQLSRLFHPYLYLPQRYSLYILPPFAVLVLACGAFGWLPRNGAKRWWHPIAGTLPGILALLFLGARGSPDEQLQIRASAAEPVYAFLRSLPAESLLAGWPSGVIDNVPWLSHRRALVTFETHQAFHVRYLEEMRRRADAVIDAFYATDPEPLRRLRDRFGVTHFVVDLDRAAPCGASYFAPFDRRIAESCERLRGQDLEVIRQIPAAAVFRDSRVAVLDLSRLSASGR